MRVVIGRALQHFPAPNGAGTFPCTPLSRWACRLWKGGFASTDGEVHQPHRAVICLHCQCAANGGGEAALSVCCRKTSRPTTNSTLSRVGTVDLFRCGVSPSPNRA